MKERESSIRFKRMEEVIFLPKGKKGPLKRSPENLAVGLSPAGPVVPAQGAVLPPHAKLPPTAIFRDEKPQDR